VGESDTRDCTRQVRLVSRTCKKKTHDLYDLTDTVGVSVTLRVHLDDRDADHSLDHDGGIVPHRNPRIRPRHQLLHSELTHVRRAAKLETCKLFWEVRLCFICFYITISYMQERSLSIR